MDTGYWIWQPWQNPSFLNLQKTILPFPNDVQSFGSLFRHFFVLEFVEKKNITLTLTKRALQTTAIWFLGVARQMYTRYCLMMGKRARIRAHTVSLNEFKWPLEIRNKFITHAMFFPLIFKDDAYVLRWRWRIVVSLLQFLSTEHNPFMNETICDSGFLFVYLFERNSSTYRADRSTFEYILLLY